MKIEHIRDVKIITLDTYKDERGFFVEKFNKTILEETQDFVQDNHSRSKAGVIRGLHYQYEPSQAKLVSVARGKIYDVIVDIRPKSPSFGKWICFMLDETKILWVPSGFAHGFCALEESDVIYKVTESYNPKTEEGIRFDDPDLNIYWPCNDPIVSTRDLELQSFREYMLNPRY